MKRHPFLENVAPWAFLIVLILLGVHIGLLLLVFMPPLGAAMLVVLSLFTWRTVRLNRQRAFLSMLAEAIERGVPLIPALQAFGEEHSWWRTRVLRLADALANGIPLADALRLFGGFVPLESLPLIEAGHRAGRLGPAFRQAAEHGGRSGPVWEGAAIRLAYLIWTVLYIIPIWIFIAVKILPAFRKIFEDFGTNLPWITQRLFDAGDLFLQLGPLLVLAGFVFFVLFIYGSRCYIGLTMFDLPGLRWMARRLDTATVLDALAFATEASRPIPGALVLLASEYPRKSVRRRLRSAWLGVAEGRDWCDCLVANRLLVSADAGVLRAAARAGNLPWAMHEMADSNRRRFAYRLQAVVQVFTPIAIVGVGLTVGFFVIACFLPLVKLIEVLA